MPYLRDEDKDEVNALRVGVAFYMPQDRSLGRLTYAIYRLAHNYLGPSAGFADYAEVLGCLEAAKLELYRRKVAPYEDTKITTNGDVL